MKHIKYSQKEYEDMETLLIKNKWVKNKFNQFKDPETGDFWQIREAWNIFKIRDEK